MRCHPRRVCMWVHMLSLPACSRAVLQSEVRWRERCQSHQVTVLLSVLQIKKAAMLTNSLHNTLFIKTHKLSLF